MDGKFVENTTFGPDLVQKVDTNLIKDVHLMVKNPEKVVDDYIRAGADIITFHPEVCKSPKKLIDHIKEKGVMVGLALNPEIPVKKIEKFLGDIDRVLVMTVHPGKGGQKMLKTPIKKIKFIRKKQSMIHIAVDGGVNDKTASSVIEAGANILVSGSYVFNSVDPKIAIDILRNS